jgi:ribosomal protein S11
MRKKKILKSKTSKQRKIKNSKYLTFKRSWPKKTFKYSSYPYIVIISFFRRNIFFTLTNYIGATKYWTNSGRSGLKGRSKINYAALTTITENFFQKIWMQGIQTMLLVFKNYNKHRHIPIIKGIKLNLKKHQFNFIGITIKNQNVFNGCHRKKLRRR